ncbi:MAG: iron-containing alcohol dehydrogenase, partial [Blastocatellia bacterium]
GVAIAVMLPHVVRWNGPVAGASYRELANDSSEALAKRLERFAAAGHLPNSLRLLNISKSDLPMLAEEAARQWTGTFNPREWSAAGALEVYECAF